MKAVLIPHMKIQNANAMSSPFTIGVPAVTAWMGFAHALERALKEKVDENIEFPSVGFVIHDYKLHAFKQKGSQFYIIGQQRKPLKKNGEAASKIEEAKIHINASVIIEFPAQSAILRKKMEKALPKIEAILHGMRLAGGEIMDFKSPEICELENPSSVMRKVGPGYTLVERRDILKEEMKNGKDALDGIIEALALHHKLEKTEEKPEKEDGKKEIWSVKRKYTGWIVPIAIGFAGVSDLGFAKNQRDPNVPHRFAESVVTLGEFRMPHRLDSLDEMMWEYKYVKHKNLYLCETKSQEKE